MRKLQDLVPNMDKVETSLAFDLSIVDSFCGGSYISLLLNSLQQTNTADMLDLAVEYIKDLQKEVQVDFK